MIFNSNILAQGCSDAGFCTMGAMRPNQNNHLFKKINLRSIEITHYFGFNNVRKGDSFTNKVNDYFQSLIIDANIGVGAKNSVQLKLPYNLTYGVMANTSGIGDISYGFTRNLIEKQHLQIGATVGGKIPLGNSNVKEGDKPLPMYYQPGLGTWDFISGLGLNYKNFLFTTGVQLPLNANNNTFLWKPWNKESAQDSIDANNYQRTNRFRRGTDVMLRIEYNLRFASWNIHTGLLNIYRINKDQFMNPAKGNKYESIPYSNGLVSSWIVGGGYRFSVKSQIKLVFAFRLNDRDAYAKDADKAPNPDGLKRFFVNTITYEYRF
ncbi:MAG: hypothetical protein EAZ07_03955 [Cytophagales bacterium]|nr:MAG: hypothetical protein EAZ07_03955 [Cytophagales bacterium]